MPVIKSWSILLALLFFQNLSATIIEVNPGDIIQTEINSMNGGDTLIINAGIYNQKIRIENLNGTINDTTIIMANGVAVLDGTALSAIGREGLITIINSSFLIVQGLEIRNFSTTGGGPTPVGILIEESGDAISLLDNHIHQISNTSTCQDPCEEGAHGLGVFGTSVSGITNILIRGNVIDNNLLQASEAFVINGNVNGFEVLNNEIHDNNNIAFDFIGFEDECSACADNSDRARNGTVSGNIARNNSSLTNPWYNGDQSAAGFYVDGGQYISFDGNTSTGNDFGFEFASEMPGKKTDNILMVNNIIHDNLIAGLIMGGYDANPLNPGGGSAEAVFVYNNTFFNQIDETEIEFQHRVINCHLTNNIIYTAGSVEFAFANSGTNNSGNVWDVNLWWGQDTSNHAGNLQGTAIVADPLFADALARNLDLLTNSPAIDSGTKQANITTWPHPIWEGLVDVHGNVDQSGGVRIVNGALDLGAIESQTGNCPAILTIDNTKILEGKFIASAVVIIEASGATAVMPISVFAPELRMDNIQFESSLVVDNTGCVN